MKKSWEKVWWNGIFFVPLHRQSEMIGKSENLTF